MLACNGCSTQSQVELAQHPGVPGSVWVGAEDTAYVVTVAGTVATSDQSGIGVSIALNTIFLTFFKNLFI